MIQSIPNQPKNEDLFKIEELEETKEAPPKKDTRFDEIFNVEEDAIRELLNESPDVNKLFDFEGASEDESANENGGLFMDKLLFTEITKEAKKLEEEFAERLLSQSGKEERVKEKVVHVNPYNLQCKKETYSLFIVGSVPYGLPCIA